MNNIPHNYPALERFTYLNSCSSGLFSREVIAFRRELDEQFQLAGSNFRAGVYEKIRAVKATVADAFGAQVERTALVPSCSHGINMVLEAMPSGKRVLQLEDDYPSIVWPLASRNFVCISIPNKVYTATEWVAQIQQHEIGILAVSAVQYSNGEIITPSTFRAIKNACPEVLILVDGTQFLGTAPFDFGQSGIDCFAASAFKWLCAGYGNGVLFLSEPLVKLVQSDIRGYNTYKNPRMEGKPSPAEYFEPGHQDLLAFQTLQFQVEQHEQISFAAIQAQIREVKTYARKCITEQTPYTVITSEHPELESGILSVEAPKELVRHLNGQGIVCSYNRGLRLGIHFYNSVEDIDLLVRAVKSYD